MADANPMERRALLAQEALDRRGAALERTLTEPAPPFQQKLSELDQTRIFLDRWQQNGLAQLRESQGGPYRDEDVDRYFLHGLKLVAKHAPQVLVQRLQEPASLNHNFLNLHEGLLVSLGRDPKTGLPQEQAEQMGQEQPEAA